jgi:hypothetical protein
MPASHRPSRRTEESTLGHEHHRPGQAALALQALAATAPQPDVGQRAQRDHAGARPSRAPGGHHRLAVPRAGRAGRPSRRRRRLGRLELRGRLAAELPGDHRLHHRDDARRGAVAAAAGTGAACPAHDRLGAVDPAARRRLPRPFRRAGQPPGDFQHRPDHARYGRRPYRSSKPCRLPGLRGARRPLAGRPARRRRLLAQLRAQRHTARLQHACHLAATGHRSDRRRAAPGGGGAPPHGLGTDAADRERLVCHQRLRAVEAHPSRTPLPMPSAACSRPACCSASRATSTPR